MKKNILIIIAIALSINLISQVQKDVFLNNKEFIGKTFDQIQDYWSTKISDEYFKEIGNSFIIMEGNVGSSQFSANFENNRCVSQDIQLTSKNISIFLARIKKEGYVFDSKNDSYFNKTKKFNWKVENVGNFYFATLSARIIIIKKEPILNLDSINRVRKIQDSLYKANNSPNPKIENYLKELHKKDSIQRIVDKLNMELRDKHRAKMDSIRNLKNHK